MSEPVNQSTAQLRLEIKAASEAVTEASIEYFKAGQAVRVAWDRLHDAVTRAHAQPDASESKS